MFRTSALSWTRNPAGAGATCSCTTLARDRRWKMCCSTGRSPGTTAISGRARDDGRPGLLFPWQSSIRLRRHLLKLFRLAAGDAQRPPPSGAQMLRQKYDLAGVVGIVRDLAVHGLQHGVGFCANHHEAHHVFRFERLDCLEHPRPAFFPPRRKIGARGRRAKLEFLVAIGSGFSPSVVRKSVKRERILPAMCFTMTATEF